MVRTEVGIDVLEVTDPFDMLAVLKGFEGCLALDVGANAGQASKILQYRFDRVVAFEPCRESFDVLVESVNHNVLPVPVAVSDHDGAVELLEYSTHLREGQLISEGVQHWNGGWGERVGKRRVPCVKIDTVVEMLGLQPDFLKVDVEGHDVQVFGGAWRTIERCHPLLYVEVHAEQMGKTLLNWLMPLYGGHLEMMQHSDYADGSIEQVNHYWLVARSR